MRDRNDIECRGHGRRESRWEDLAEAFEQAGRLLYHCLGKRRGQGRILRVLCEQGQMSQRKLQEVLHIQPSSMSEIAAKLEGRGLIARDRDGADKRKILLSVTEEGRAWVARRDDDAIRQQRAELFSSLSQEEQKTLRTLLEKLSADWTRRLESEKQ